jgi:hypothetical protein
MSPTQLRVTAGLNLLASCAGVVFFALNLYRLFAPHQTGSHRALLVVLLFVYAYAAWFFWGRYRYFTGLTSRSGPAR